MKAPLAPRPLSAFLLGFIAFLHAAVAVMDLLFTALAKLFGRALMAFAPLLPPTTVAFPGFPLPGIPAFLALLPQPALAPLFPAALLGGTGLGNFIAGREWRGGSDVC